MATKTSTPTRSRTTSATSTSAATARPKARAATSASASRPTKAASTKAASTKAASTKAAATAAAEEASRAARRALPTVRVPKVELPKVDLPKVQLPKLELPKVNVPKVELPEQLTTAQQHVVSTAKQVAARLNDRLDPTHRRTVVLDRVDQAQHQTLNALEGIMTRTEKVRAKVELPFAGDVREAIHQNVEFVVTLAKRQVEFAERVVKTLVPAA